MDRRVLLLLSQTSGEVCPCAQVKTGVRKLHHKRAASYRAAIANLEALHTLFTSPRPTSLSTTPTP